MMRSSNNEVELFLRTVITTPEGWFCLALHEPGNWREEWYRWPEDVSQIMERAAGAAATHNVYFSSYLFSERSSLKSNVLPSRTIQADLDEADYADLPLKATAIVGTSIGRSQAYWVLTQALEPDVHETLSRAMTYSIKGCDRSGWPLGRKVRFPGTLNHKYADIQEVTLELIKPEREYQQLDFESLPPIPRVKILGDEADDTWIDSAHDAKYEKGPRTTLEKWRGKIPVKDFTQYGRRQDDRSVALWSFMCSLFRQGCPRDEVFFLAWHSANNKFKELKHNAERELAKDVLRAEMVVRNKVPDVRSQILDIRRMPVVLATERRQQILRVVQDALREQGEFIHTQDELLWYLRRDTGRPISISGHSEHLGRLLDVQFGLNRTEVEHTFVSYGLMAYTGSLPTTAVTGSMSSYQVVTNTLLVHSGSRDVYRLTAQSVETVPNGAGNVVFQWSSYNEPFILRYEAGGGSPVVDQTAAPWHEVLFGNALSNVLDMTADEAMSILRVWSLFILFRDAAVSRPILALFGQPGAGKSTMFRRIYAFLYGRRRALGGVTNMDDFDHASSSEPLVVLDNVDTWERWLPDRLALSASSSDIIRRRLYTDSDLLTIRRQALIGLTAHNPKFGREDIADRMLLINFQRLQHFLSEGDILDRISRTRNELWASYLADAQRVLATPMPAASEAPQFRIEDFARIGWRIATALGIQTHFASALARISRNQKVFNLEEDHTLVSALQRLTDRRNGKADNWLTMTELWRELERTSADPSIFTRAYRNAGQLGKKMWAMHDSLKVVFDIEWMVNTTSGARMWRVRKKDASVNDPQPSH